MLEPVTREMLRPAFVREIVFHNVPGRANATEAFEPIPHQGEGVAQDITRPLGPVAPLDPYPDASTPPVEAPVATSIDPASAVAGTPAIIATITGSGFTSWTTLVSGNVPTDYVVYISPTELRVAIDPMRANPGITEFVVIDHGMESAPVAFTFTAPEPPPEDGA
jgi:hypothetical protein